MDLTTEGVLPSAEETPRRSGRQIAMVVLIAAVALMAFWGTPTNASEAAFGAAVRSGDVRSWEADPQGSRYGLEMTVGFEVHFSSGAPSTTVIWSDSHGRLYRTSVANLLSLQDPAAPQDANFTDPSAGVFWSDGYQVDVVQTVDATARAGGVPPPTYGLGPVRYLGWPLLLLTIGFVVVLLVAKQPRRRTKWGTFWMLGIPAGVGPAWWVLTDSPWSPVTNALPEPAPRQRGPVPGVVDRRGGGAMFLIAFGLSLVVGFVLLVVRVVPGLGDRPAPPQGSVTWQVVWSTGSTGSLQE